MCTNMKCSALAQPVHGRRCSLCGTRTDSYDTYWASELTAPAVRTGLNTEVQPLQPLPSVLIVTTNEIPGYRIVSVHGDVFGILVRARNYFANLGAQFRSVVGGEVGGYTKLLTDSRNVARERLMQAARDLGANAVVAMRFDCNEIGDIMSEVVAYGTAVSVVKDETSAT